MRVHLATWLGGPFLRGRQEKGTFLSNWNHDRWENFYVFMFMGLIVYYCWDYVVAIMAVCGAYFIWREWSKPR